MAVQLDFLNSVPYFSGLGTAELGEIRKLIVEKKADRGDMLVLEGEQVRIFHFVVSGVVKAFKTSVGGKEQILKIVRHGEAFSDIPVFDDGPSPCSVQAMGDVVLYEISKADLEVILRKYPQVALNVISVLAGRVRHLVSLVEDLSFRHVIGRVAKILLENAEDGAGHGQRLTQQDMAAIAGTAREVVGRSLKALEDDGVISLDKYRIVINDREALKGIIESSF